MESPRPNTNAAAIRSLWFFVFPHTRSSKTVARMSALLRAKTSANKAKNQKEKEVAKARAANSEEKKLPSESSEYLLIKYRQIKNNSTTVKA